MWKKTLLVLAVFVLAVGPAKAALIEVALTADVASSSPAAFGSLLAGTVDDPFAYDPDSPTSPVPALGYATTNGYHGNGAGGADVTLWYTLSEITFATGDSFIFDVYGRGTSNAAQLARDDDFEVALFTGGSGGTLVASITGNGLPDVTPYYARADFSSTLSAGDKFDAIRIIGHDSGIEASNFFTIMEVAAAYSVAVPEPGSLLLATFGLAFFARRRRS